MKFDDIAGQKEVTAALKNILSSERVGHAWIFSGPDGIGKKTVAKIFAAALLCTGRNGAFDCGECKACKLYERSSNPDFNLIDGAGGTIGVDVIRDMQEDIIIKPLYSEKKVYLITSGENMTVQAQNCLLKTLESPPSYGVIIINVSNDKMLRETVRSRAIKFEFRRCRTSEIRTVLERRFGEDLEDLDFIASYSGGIIGKALELAESAEFREKREAAIEIMEKLGSESNISFIDACGFFADARENVNILLDIMTTFYRDLLVSKLCNRPELLINSDKRDIIFSNAKRYTVSGLLDNIYAVESTRKNLQYNANYLLAVEVMLMKLQEAAINDKSCRSQV